MLNGVLPGVSHFVQTCGADSVATPLSCSNCWRLIVCKDIRVGLCKVCMLGEAAMEWVIALSSTLCVWLLKERWVHQVPPCCCPHSWRRPAGPPSHRDSQSPNTPEERSCSCCLHDSKRTSGCEASSSDSTSTRLLLGATHSPGGCCCTNQTVTSPSHNTQGSC